MVSRNVCDLVTPLHIVSREVIPLSVEQALALINHVKGHRLGVLLMTAFVTGMRRKELLKEAGLPPIRFHDLRHSAATILLSMGVNIKVIRELLGHSDISITLGLYSHLLPSMQQEAVDTWDGVFGQDKEKEGNEE